MRKDAVGAKRWAWKDEQGLIKGSTSAFENYSQEKLKRIAEEFPTIPEEHIQTVWAQYSDELVARVIFAATKVAGGELEPSDEITAEQVAVQHVLLSEASPGQVSQRHPAYFFEISTHRVPGLDQLNDLCDTWESAHSYLDPDQSIKSLLDALAVLTTLELDSVIEKEKAAAK